MRLALYFALLSMGISELAWGAEQTQPSMSVVPFRLAQASSAPPNWQQSHESGHGTGLPAAEAAMAVPAYPSDPSPLPGTRPSHPELVDGVPPAPARLDANGAGIGAGATVTVVSSLAIVVGCFLLFVWVMRRLMPRGTSSLPREAVEILGRAPLDARQHLQLIRVGNKLVLLAVAPNRVQSLCEITDPREIDYLLHVCQVPGLESHGDSIREVFQRLGSDAAPGPSGSRARQHSTRGVASNSRPLGSVAGTR